LDRRIGHWLSPHACVSHVSPHVDHMFGTCRDVMEHHPAAQCDCMSSHVMPHACHMHATIATWCHAIAALPMWPCACTWHTAPLHHAPLVNQILHSMHQVVTLLLITDESSIACFLHKMQQMCTPKSQVHADRMTCACQLRFCCDCESTDHALACHAGVTRLLVANAPCTVY
jgi:hypothetical protein